MAGFVDAILRADPRPPSDEFERRIGPPLRRSTDRVDAGIAMQAATAGERSWCATLVVVLVGVCVAVLPSHQAFSPTPAFIAAFAGTTGGADALTAVLLLSLYFADGSRALLVIAAGYTINAVLIVPYALTFPGVIDARGFIGNEQSAATLWLTWHITFPFAVAIGSFADRLPIAQTHRPRAALLAAVVCLAVAGVAIVGVTAGRAGLPILVRAGGFSPLFSGLSLSASMLSLTAATLVLRARRPVSALSLWTLVALVAAALDTALNMAAPGRFSLPWYVGKALTFVSASIVLFALLAAWSTLQTRSAALARRLALTINDGRLLQAELERKREIAAALQHALLPSALPRLDGITLHAAYRPAMNELEIGGDWYDAFVLADGRLVLTIGDVLGHGLSASVVMGHVRFSLRMAASMVADPSLMLTIADAMLRSEHPDIIVTAFVGVLDRNGRLDWASAGHPPVMIRAADGAIVELASPGPPLGLYDVGSTAAEIILSPNSLLVAYTDGLIEVERDVISGLERMRSVIAGNELIDHHDPAAWLFEAIVGQAARDDVAVMTLAFAGGDRP